MTEKEIKEAAIAESNNIYKPHMEPDEYWYPNSAIINLQKAAFAKGANWQASQQQGWIDANDRLPEMIKDHEYSENVFGVVDGQIGIYCLCLIWNDELNQYGYCWAACYDNINGDGEYDDEYKVTHWVPLPTPPTDK